MSYYAIITAETTLPMIATNSNIKIISIITGVFKLDSKARVLLKIIAKTYVKTKQMKPFNAQVRKNTILDYLQYIN